MCSGRLVDSWRRRLRLLRFATGGTRCRLVRVLSGETVTFVDLARWERDLHGTVRRPRPGPSGGPQTLLGRRPIRRRRERRALLVPLAGASSGPGLAHGAIGVGQRVSRYCQPLFKVEYTIRGTGSSWPFRATGVFSGLNSTPVRNGCACGRRAGYALLPRRRTVIEWLPQQTWIPDQSFFHTVLPISPIRAERYPFTYVILTTSSDGVGTWCCGSTIWALSNSPVPPSPVKFDPSVDSTSFREHRGDHRHVRDRWSLDA